MRGASDYVPVTCSTCGAQYRTTLSVIECGVCRAVTVVWRDPMPVTTREVAAWLESSENQFCEVLEGLHAALAYGGWRQRWVTGVAQ